MGRREALKALAAFGFCAACAKASLAGEAAAHWSYEGDHGPAHWGDLDAADKICAIGSQQSPIAIDSSIAAELPPLRFDWPVDAAEIVNNGHTIQLNFDEGAALKVGPDVWRLAQLHFHHPCEHLIDDKASAMEIHFVHRNEKGLAVVGALVKPGKSNPTFRKIVAAMPGAEGPAQKAPAGLNPRGLLPKARGYFRYSGSLTTPPCSETVDWLVLRHPVEVLSADIDAFAELYPMNARPAQQIDRRFVLRSV
ncbi:carbonic anhydrase [Methylocella silvestris]|uniref:carbonic anhydrase n=1 Tax=Methylocella silvestris TaxID=199596 RepID=UPI00059D3D27|nr:carbonic anhydrase family protein [Methylocella silvestris]